MSSTRNLSLIYKSTPNGLPVAGQDLDVEDRPIDLSATPTSSHPLLLKNHYFSFDPYQRGRMRDPSIKSYTPPYTIGEPIDNASVSTVVASALADFQKGDLVTVFRGCPMQEYCFLSAEVIKQPGAVAKIAKSSGKVDPKHYLGALGMPGLTAYSSFYEIGAPIQKGDTIFISSAAGAVGQIVGQLAKREGLRVIGSVGSNEKAEWLKNELKFDEAFNYKEQKPMEALKKLAPEGLDIYFENVGGEHLEAALAHMKNNGRIVTCGMISQYNSKPHETYHVKNLGVIVQKRLKMQGFIVHDWLGPKYRDEWMKNVTEWLSDRSLKAKLNETPGMEKGPEGLVGMLQGKNFGKAILVVNDP